MKLSDFDYALPKELIAQKGITPRDNSRLMIVKGGKVYHKHFYDIAEHFEKDDVLVINESKVIPAKLTGRKSTGANVELMLSNKKQGNTYYCRIKGGRPKLGNILLFKEGVGCKIIGNEENLFIAEFNKNIDNILDRIGEMPYPPYIKQKVENPDSYQTVYAKKKGSIAAPTAGLHFTPELLEKLQKKGVKIAKLCLHVGFGTFIPVRHEDIKQHKMEKEFFTIDDKTAEIINSCKNRLIVTGTTSLRALETAADENGVIKAGSAWSSLFIYPGYKFKTKFAGFITNFHLPKSTLFMLVCALMGREKMLELYNIAIKEKYRFYSFGDAMFLWMENLHPQ